MADGNKLRISLIGCTAILLLCLPVLSFAEEKILHFQIPAQPLGDALANYSRTIGQTVIFNPDLTRDLLTSAIDERLTAREAVDRLLEDTPLEARQTPHGWLVEFKPQPQPAPKPIERPPPVSRPNEILVLGRYTHAISSATAERREADQRLDVILAEEVGKFPALNVAEALNRSPGISVVRDRGEAIFLSIRGLPTQFNHLTLNGHAIATHENMRTSEQFGRRFHYDTLPAELVSAVEVKKSTLASDDEGAIGGSVNIRSFQPLNMEQSGATLTVGASHSSLAQSTRPRLSGLGSWVNSERTMGFLLAGAYSQRALRQDRALNFRWYPVDDTGVPSSEGALISPGSVRPTLELEERERLGLSAAWQWEVSDTTRIALNGLYTTQNLDYEEFSYSADYNPTRLQPESIVWRNNALVEGATEFGSAQISRESAEMKGWFNALDLTLERDWGDSTLTVALADSKAVSENSKPIRRTRLRREQDVALDFRYSSLGDAAVPEVNYRNVSLTNPGDFPGRRLEWRSMAATDRRSTLQFMLNRPLSGSAIASLDVGAQVSERSRDYRRWDALLTADIEGRVFPQAYFVSMPVDNFLAQSGGQLPGAWLIPNEALFWESVDRTRLDEGRDSARDARNSYQIEELVSSTFVQLNIAPGRWRATLGLRYAHTSQKSSGHQVRAGESEPVEFSKDYDHLLPSANLALDLTPNLVWRSSVGRVINRADLQDLAPRLTVSSGDEPTAVGGNPQLNPVAAWQYETGVEWYWGKSGWLSMALFRTELDGFIQTDTLSTEIDGVEHQLTTSTNGARAEVTGVEIDFHRSLDGLRLPEGTLSVQANATRAYSKAHYRLGDGFLTDALADVAETTANMSLYYESEKVDVRLSYSWRSEVLKEVGTFDQEAQNSSPFGSLDAQLSFNLGPGTLFFEGINLTGEAEQEFVANNEFAGYTYYGKTLLVGYKWDFN